MLPVLIWRWCRPGVRRRISRSSRVLWFVGVVLGGDEQVGWDWGGGDWSEMDW